MTDITACSFCGSGDGRPIMGPGVTICRTCAAKALQLEHLEEWQLLRGIDFEVVLSMIFDRIEAVDQIRNRKRTQGLDLIAEEGDRVIVALQTAGKLLTELREIER